MKNVVGVILIFILLSSIGCESHNIDARLAQVNDLANAGEADSAIALLQSIEKTSLNEYNSRYHDLMDIKTRDKADADITGDTAIVDIMEYFDDEGPDEVRGEAYYYGGRVYREMGDAPQALDYYQKAQDAYPQDQAFMKGKIASQMGQIFNSLYLFEQANTKYNEAVQLQLTCNDTRGVVLNYHSLGENYVWLNKFDSAMCCYTEALKLIDKIDNNNVIKIEIHTAKIDLFIKQKDFDNALQEFKHIEPYLHENYISNYVLATALNIYLYKDDLINAEKISKKLVESGTNYGEILGYSVLADIAKVNKHIKRLYDYTDKYKKSVDEYNSTASQNAVIHQNSFYNYSTKVKEILSLENSKLRLYISVILAIIIIIGGTIFSAKIYKKISVRNKQLINRNSELLQSNKELLDANKELHKNVNDLFNKIEFLEKEMSTLIEDTYPNNNVITELSDALRLQIYNQIKEFDIETFNLSQDIIESEIWMKFRMAINFNNKINLEDWAELDAIVNKCYPDFRKKIYLLDHTLSDVDYKTCLLVKCRFNNNEIGFLTNRERSSSPQSRKRLFKKLFKLDKSATELDKFILSL